MHRIWKGDDNFEQASAAVVPGMDRQSVRILFAKDPVVITAPFPLKYHEYTIPVREDVDEIHLYFRINRVVIVYFRDGEVVSKHTSYS
jgi:hypothetical protein